MHQARYISLIGWSKVCAGWEEGGLEIRDLGLFNEALLLKLVWQVAADADKIWVQIFKAKYYPRKGLWGNSSVRGYSALGRVVQQLKPFFLEEVLWHVGSGEGISAINQPWYDGWDTQQCNTNAQRDAKVVDLFDHSTREWDTHKIQILMSEGAVTAITNSARKPKQHPLIGDRLIWLCSQRGTYTTKEGYKKLKEQMLAPTQHYTDDQKRAWQRVWSNKEIIPRIKFFLWRAIHNGLPTLQKLHSRIPGINPRYQRCDSEDEFLMHTLFFCHIARQTWWVSELGLRVDRIPLTFPRAFLEITDNLRGAQVTLFANMCWYLWKARNEAIFAHKAPTAISILAQVRIMQQTRERVAQSGQHQPFQHIQPIQVRRNTTVILLDASWEASTRAGWGSTCYDDKGQLISVQYSPIIAAGPLHAEALALLESLKLILVWRQSGMLVRALVLSDCQVLINAVITNQLVELPTWRSTGTVAECARIYQSCKSYTTLQKAAREVVQEPHLLANWARRTRQVFRGNNGESAAINFTLETLLNQELFQFSSD